MKIDDLLLSDPGLRTYASMPEMDPLTEDDALQEAQLLDIRFDAKSGVLGLLFELRTALQLQEANTGVLIATGVRELAWFGPRRDTTVTAWSIGSSAPRPKDRLFVLSLVMWPHPGAQLTLTAESAAFFIGNVPGLPEAPPDYTRLDRHEVSAEIAGWNSPFEPVSAVFMDAAPPT